MSIAQYRKQHCFSCYEIQGVIDHILMRLDHKVEAINKEGQQTQDNREEYTEVVKTVLNNFLVDNSEYQQYEEWLLRDLLESIKKPEKSEDKND